MNLIPLAALLIAALAFATSITALILTERLRKRWPRRQHQSSGHGSIQVQTGGDLHLPDDWEPPSAALIAKNGRHL